MTAKLTTAEQIAKQRADEEALAKQQIKTVIDMVGIEKTMELIVHEVGLQAARDGANGSLLKSRIGSGVNYILHRAMREVKQYLELQRR